MHKLLLNCFLTTLFCIMTMFLNAQNVSSKVDKSNSSANTELDSLAVEKAKLRHNEIVVKEESSSEKTSTNLYPHLPVNDGTENYQVEKAAWVKKYPEEYKAWIKANASPTHTIDAEEFKTMPKNKRDVILANPNYYIIKEIKKGE